MSRVDRNTPGKIGAETRHRILLAAVELFTVKGFAGTSVRDIAEQTDLTKAALYYHFSSKEEILDAVTEPLLAEFEALVDGAGGDPVPPPSELLAGMVDILSRRIGLMYAVLADPSINRKPDHKKAEKLIDGLAEAIARGSEPEHLLQARCALGAAQGGVLATVTHAPQPVGPPDRERVRRLLEGQDHLLTEGERGQIVAAALRALG